MILKNKNIGFAITGAFYGIENAIKQMKVLKNFGINIYPIMSYSTYFFNDKFKNFSINKDKIISVSNNRIIYSMKEAESICKTKNIDLLVILPCTSNTISKLANDIIDTPVTLAAKSLLKYEKPIVIGLFTNTGLSSSAENIGKLLNRKNYFFIPFKQDNPITKPRSLVCDYNYTYKTIVEALNKKQISPIIL